VLLVMAKSIVDSSDNPPLISINASSLCNRDGFADDAEVTCRPSSAWPIAPTVRRVTAQTELSAALNATFSQIDICTCGSASHGKPAWLKFAAISCTVGLSLPLPAQILMCPSPWLCTTPGATRSAGKLVMPTMMRSAGTTRAMSSALPSPFCTESAQVCGPTRAH
jgi:hypothetical protein